MLFHDIKPPSLPCQAVGLDFFRSVVAACRMGQLSQCDARRFVTSFLESKASSVSSRPKRGTGQYGHCGLGCYISPSLDSSFQPGWS